MSLPEFSHADKVRAAESYIMSLGCTLYGQAWDITQPERRRQAAEWLVDAGDAITRQVVKLHYDEELAKVKAERRNGHNPIRTTDNL